MNETHASSPNPDLFTAAQAVAAGIDFAELSASPAGLFWSEFRPQDAASRIWRWRNGDKICLTPEGFSVRSRVYEYGGGSFCVTDNAVAFVNEADQQIYVQAFEGGLPEALTTDDKRYGDVRFAHGQILAVEEDGDVHRLVAIDLADAQRHVLAEGADFYASPVMSPDGNRLVWIEWWRPHQPWTSTRLMSVERHNGGNWGRPHCLAGGLGLESLQQPRFDACGRLYCLTDRAGFWQPWVETLEGLKALPAASADHAPAPWQLGGSTWLPIDHTTYLATWSEDGVGKLGIQSARGDLDDFSSSYSRFRSLAMDDDYLYCIAASAVSPSAVLAIGRTDKNIRVLAGGVAPLPPTRISQPQTLRYPSGGEEAHGYFYPAMNGEEKPPLVVFIHGGPTSACYPVLDPRIQYWTQRGFAVADLNYRGSTGYGRAYRQALFLEWGVADVEDACAAVEYLGDQGLIDPDKAFIRGGSAGGYTALCALAFKDVFRAGASLYGVSDPLALAEATHKFEADYLDWLIGDPDIDMARYKERTPLLHADRITAPVIFFQGELDAVVVPAQTRDMLNALLDRGILAEGHFYPDERHGFRKASNQAHALETEWAFYRKVLEG
ncbi:MULTISPECIES: S9 family peptidase [unclassified Pseudomonas]|uniref:S9 family peptidase n=1 Tax=unclassified Pseudomonas TaxID=196821 RepID=UPI000D341B57|nr:MULTISPECIES: S9 family peptidase [unclassified Pseudomonas]RAU46244.1 S9 family peptidase [Pseudomonas sp. RIT 409]RAU53710.1 S9 family peptidase [Pseudomonas sp. RIT 412]